MTTSIFIHGLDSSGSGTKGRYFAARFPTMLRPDFSGPLEQRMERLAAILAGGREITLIGSSFGGLMAACYAIREPESVRRLILLAPALHLPEYLVPEPRIAAPATLIIGRDDTVTPPAAVIPAAEKSFARLRVELVDDDHLLHRTFPRLDWYSLLG